MEHNTCEPTLKTQAIYVVIGFFLSEITGLGSLWIPSNSIIQDLKSVVFTIKPAAASRY